MEPWYKVVTPRREVREGRSFSPDEFAIALEHVVAGMGTEDYRDGDKFFARTVFTRALSDHVSLVLRRLAGQTSDTAPVLTLVTQFGGGKTHTLTSLYHLANGGAAAERWPGVKKLLEKAELSSNPGARVGVFVGNSWDPRAGRETPWIDLARQVAGDAGVVALGDAALTVPPGTESLARMFDAVNRPVLLLFDEVLNFVNRHRAMADGFYAFIQNLTVATTARASCVAVISLPRSQVEMTERDQEWQDRITKVVRRVAKDLIATDEGEVSEVVRRRLFESLGEEKIRKKVARAYADWCFERRHQLPPEWTAVDTSTTDAQAREYLQSRFLACYPFHPATISVFQRKWQALTHYQQTRGTLAMLAQWVSLASVESFKGARAEPLLTLGSAPLDQRTFRSVVLGQLGESRLSVPIEVDIAGDQSHAKALDATVQGPLARIHRRVASTIFFESSGGQLDRTAHLPELRFAVGGPGLDTTSIDTAAQAFESRAFYVRKVGADGYQFTHRTTLRKVVNDRRASLDEENEIRPAMEKAVRDEFDRGKTVPVQCFAQEGSAVGDTPRLTVWVIPPHEEWDGAVMRDRLRDWTQLRGTSPRLYPASIVWCIRKPGRELHDAVASWLAWKRVQKEAQEGTLGPDFDALDLAEAGSKAKEAAASIREEIWASYRYIALRDAAEPDGLKVIDLGAGHASAGESLVGRILQALRTNSLLGAGLGAGYLQRNWPNAHAETGAWPLLGLRQSLVNGSLIRLVDPEATLLEKIPEFVFRGEFGYATGLRPDGSFDRVWYQELIPADELSIDAATFLVTRERAVTLRIPVAPELTVAVKQTAAPTASQPAELIAPASQTAKLMRLRIHGRIPPELWNRVGAKLLTKLKQHEALQVAIDLQATLDEARAEQLVRELRESVADLALEQTIRVEATDPDRP
ncbi:MAG: DUF499 domain-containing protein [Longimicrobiales bacterium]